MKIPISQEFEAALEAAPLSNEQKVEIRKAYYIEEAFHKLNQAALQAIPLPNGGLVVINLN